MSEPSAAVTTVEPMPAKGSARAFPDEVSTPTRLRELVSRFCRRPAGRA